MRKEIDERQKKESGGFTVNTVAKIKKALILLLSVLTYPKQKGRASDSHGRKSKPSIITSLHLKTNGNHALT